MANINLISARRAERVRLSKIARGLGVSIVLSMTVGFGAVAFTFGQIIMTGSSLAKAEVELERLRPILDDIAAAEQQRMALAPKLTTLTEAQKRTRRWWDVMEGFKRAVPSETWLTNIAVEKGAAEEDQLMRINGVTANQARVGETMFRLSQQQDYYQKVDLRFTQTNRSEASERVEFELAAHLTPLDPKAAKASAEEEEAK